MSKIVLQPPDRKVVWCKADGLKTFLFVLKPNKCREKGNDGNNDRRSEIKCRGAYVGRESYWLEWIW